MSWNKTKVDFSQTTKIYRIGREHGKMHNHHRNLWIRGKKRWVTKNKIWAKWNRTIRWICNRTRFKNRWNPVAEETSMNKQKKTMKMDSQMEPNIKITQKRWWEMFPIWYMGETKFQSIKRKTFMNSKSSNLIRKNHTRLIPSSWSLCQILTTNPKIIMHSKMLIKSILKSNNIPQ